MWNTHIYLAKSVRVFQSTNLIKVAAGALTVPTLRAPGCKPPALPAHLSHVTSCFALWVDDFLSSRSQVPQSRHSWSLIIFHSFLISTSRSIFILIDDLKDRQNGKLLIILVLGRKGKSRATIGF